MSRHLLIRSCLFTWLMLAQSPQLRAENPSPLRQNLGPVEKNKTYRFSLDEHFVTFKVQTFAETQAYRITCDAPAGWTALVDVRGPVASAHNVSNPPADESESGMASAVSLVKALQGERIHESIELPPDGVYELHVSWRAVDGAEVPAAGATLEFAGECLAGCTRPALGLDEVLKKLQAPGQSRQLLAQIELQLAAMMPELPEVREELLAQWDAALASGDMARLRRFPTLPVTSLTKVKDLTALGALAMGESAPVGVIRDSLDRALAHLAKGHSWPTLVPLSKEVPYEVRYGNFPNLALTDEQVANSHALATILNALAEGNGSWIDFDGKRLTTPVDLIRQLMTAKDAKHRVRLKQPKAYANFLSFAIGEYDLRMPIWIDSGLEVAGKALVVPAGHSEHAWWIDGPLVNARIAFYLGTRGAAFLPSTVIAAGWTGERIHDEVGFSVIEDRQAHEQVIAESFEAAVAYFQRLRLEEKSLGLSRGLGTYGCLGVCNDSDCAVELLRKGCYSSYPLLRDSDLSLLPDLALPHFGSVVALKLATLPNDSKPEGQQRREVLRRILNMAPHPLAAADRWFDKELYQHMKEVERELAEVDP